MPKTSLKTAALGAVLFASCPAAAGPVQARALEIGRDATISYANAGGIRDWYAGDDRSIYLMDRTNRWYLAKLTAPCRGLRFNQAVVFNTDPSGIFDTFSKVRTRDHVCSVEKVVRALRPKAKGGRGQD